MGFGSNEFNKFNRKSHFRLKGWVTRRLQAMGLTGFSLYSPHLGGDGSQAVDHQRR
jgi:hypothetical protein